MGLFSDSRVRRDNTATASSQQQALSPTRDDVATTTPTNKSKKQERNTPTLHPQSGGGGGGVDTRVLSTDQKIEYCIRQFMRDPSKAKVDQTLAKGCCRAILAKAKDKDLNAVVQDMKRQLK